MEGWASGQLYSVPMVNFLCQITQQEVFVSRAAWGKSQMMLIRDVFSTTFIGYLCFPYTEKHLTVVDTELQHRSLSMIVGRIYYSTYVGFESRELSAHFADGELVPPLQGADNVTFSDDSIGSYESSSPEIGSI